MAALLTAGCGLFGGDDSGSDAASSDTTAKTAGPLEKSTLNVGVMVGIDCSGAQMALLRDLFKEEGLTIKPETVQSGAVAIPKLASGGLDFTFGNWVSFLKAQAAGAVDMRFVSESYIATPNTNFALITGPDSGISSVKDLVGKTVAVNAKGNINELLIRAVMEANDIDFNSINLVEMGFPDMTGALQAKTVDVASLIDPFVALAQQKIGAKIVVDLTGKGSTENFPTAGFATTAKFAKDNPNTVAAFQRVLLKGQQLAGDRKNVEEALPKFAKLDPETAAIVKIGQFPTTIDSKRLQRIADLLQTYQMLPKKLDVKPLVIPMPTSSS
ncbi:ABC transporter substrate-binding protein [Actinophytocola oryzae]|uniref:NitT/TauT family transport system substrate-binding protein n=1 Tax=Actinophytocola oryzae TaxID=502181 RepID=A0A4R7V003_9PSEU|nr:ABC transporter substrate-binding protein [Actinophytocola oryzae]TDV41854.1 NitT/TauT family transport system substrate-binding protein [Actinophytocola oryzae]